MFDQLPSKSAPRAIIYARYSTDMQNPNSARDQIHLCEREAVRRGWKVIERIDDKGMSGAIEQRPGFQRLRAALLSKTCDIIVIESLDRVSRDQEHLARLYKEATFNDVEIHTLDKGKVDIIQVGFGGTMAALFLETLAFKTRRGLEARVRAGKSAGGRSYGYRVALDDNGNAETGKLSIDEAEATVVRRIFREFAEGRSPLKIAAMLNADGVPAPRSGKGTAGAWKQNTINGNRERGTGILNNELYIGRRVWNRLRYLKDPATGRRVSRLNPPDEWQVSDVPALRVVDDALWQAVKDRQKGLAKVRSKRTAHDRNGLSASQGLRRRKYLLSGLLYCGKCGGSLTVAGTSNAKRYYCANAKEKGPAVCSGMPGLSARVAEETVLHGLRRELMTDEAFAAFKAAFTRHLREARQAAAETTQVRERAIRKLEREKSALIEAVKRGRAADVLLDELDEVSKQLETLRLEQAGSAQPTVDLPDDLPTLYRSLVRDLIGTLNDEGVSGRASEAIHEMIERITVCHNTATGEHELALDGNIVSMLTLTNPPERTSYEAKKSSLKLVAG